MLIHPGTDHNSPKWGTSGSDGVLDDPGCPVSLPALSLVAEPLADTFHRDGYLVLRDVVDTNTIDTLVDRLSWLVERESGLHWSSLASVSLARHLSTHPDVRDAIIERARVPAWLTHFVLQPAIVQAVRSAMGESIQMLRRVDLELTPPMEPSLLTPWHQDYFYVRGSRSTITAHMPLQDTTLREGCLQIMPGSHRVGPVAHDRMVLGKRHMPSGIEDREVRMVPLYKGDLVLLHSLTLRQDALNLSPAVRSSVSARFIPRGADWSRSMGGVMDVI